MTFGDPEQLTAVTQVVQATKANGNSATVHQDRPYTLVHLGVTAAGVVVTDPIYFTFQQDFGDSGAPSANMTAEGNKLPLRGGHSITLPPGITKIAYRFGASAQSHAMFGITGGPVYFGDGY